ncbi:ShlB/FhaC/HecB family hemolysin secretion/activation protein [Lyngbya aestuarii]|uniref:ShlB/FhaC/HecB family hemolysin secretion/activation protein n=1 Tax=Lyngbya aestuarii TaxID=118322 RepID=UPI00403D91D5
MKIITISVFNIATVSLASSALSQSPPDTPLPTNLPETIEQTIPNPPDTFPPIVPESLQVPPELNLPTPSPPAEIENPTSDSEGLQHLRKHGAEQQSTDRFLIKQVEVLGNTVLQAEIAELIAPIENSEATFEELIELRSKITQLYFDNGYVTSGAFLLNNQPLNSGLVQIKVVEGKVEQINISGLEHLQPGYVRQRIAIATKTPLNRQKLEEALQLLQLDPLIEQLNAELTASATPGSNILQIKLIEAPAFHSGVGVANSQSPSIGSAQVSLGATHENLLGFGDRLSAEYGITDGLDIYGINYTIPVNGLNGTFNLSYSEGDSTVIEKRFRDLDIESKTSTFSLGFRQPLTRSPEKEFALGLALELRRRQTFLEGDPFTFQQGAPEDGESNATIIRFYQDWLDRNAQRVFAARSQFSLGIDAFGATITDSDTDGQFFSWIGQFQWVQRLSPRNTILARIGTQLTPDSLLSIEKFGIGGVDTVRGYRQNQLVGDNGIISSVEVRLPLTSNPERLQLVPFFDLGIVWNNRDPDPDPGTIAGVGVALNWLIGSDWNLRLDYGIPLVNADRRGNSLQDNGLYFSLRYQPF